MDHVVVVLAPVPEDLSAAAATVAQRFRIPEDRALQLLRRAPGPVTKPVPEAQARTVAAILSEAGLTVEMREGDAEGPAVPYAAPLRRNVAAQQGPVVSDQPSSSETPAGTETAADRPDAGQVAPPDPQPGSEAVGDESEPSTTLAEDEARGDAAAERAVERSGASGAPGADARHSDGTASRPPPAGTTTTTPPRDPMKTTLTREPPEVDRHGLSRRIATAATVPAILTLLTALIVLSAALLPVLRDLQLERARSTATAVAAVVEGLTDGVPLSAPLVRTQLRAAQQRAAAALPSEGVDLLAVLDASGEPVLALDAFGQEVNLPMVTLISGATSGEVPAERGWAGGAWHALLAVLGLADADPVVATADVGSGGARSGTVVVGIDSAATTAKVRRVLLTTLLVGLVPVLLGLLAALSLTRGVTEAVRYLLVATDRISHGDLERPVALDRDDELGQIAKAVERMRISLREGMERLRRRR